MSNLGDLIRSSIEATNRMTPEEREAMYREQCRPYDPFAGRSPSDLENELADVNMRLAAAKDWGASVAALYEWKEDIERELRRRYR